MLDFDPEGLPDEEITARLEEEYPPEDFLVSWWWAFPAERRGFCLNTAFRHAISVEDFLGAMNG